jgi:hypothetical protein
MPGGLREEVFPHEIVKSFSTSTPNEKWPENEQICGTLVVERETPATMSGEDTAPVLNPFANFLSFAEFAYFRGKTESFIALPTRNFSVVFAGI